MFKHFLLIMALGAILLVTTSYFFFEEEVPAPEEGFVDRRYETLIYLDTQPLMVDIADQSFEQMQGLSGRDNMDQNNGMLFIFPQSLEPAFWMKDMHFALDLLWIDENGILIAIDREVAPETFPQTFLPPSPIKYVLEVNAGWSDRNNIKIGGKLRLQ